MIPPWPPYRLAVMALSRLAPLAARWSPKLAQGLAGRRLSGERFTAWGAARRDHSRPLLLLHAASAGELRQAEPVLARLQTRHPSWQVAVTCFSPSGLPVADALNADVAGLLPFDRPAAVAAFLDALAPSAIVYSRSDLWPELAHAASARGIPQGMIAATLPADSRRRRWPASRVLRPALNQLATIGAVSADDAYRLTLLGARPEVVSITGDPRYDAAVERLERFPAPTVTPATLVAGSTWAADEVVLLTAFAAVREAIPGARLLIAPHEPTPAHLAGLTARARAAGFPPPVPWQSQGADAPLAVVTEVGGLARLYGTGQLAYVGGGFGRVGLHSVLEPAASGVPVIVGPLGQRSPDAIKLNTAGALAWLPRRRAAAVLAAWWETWLVDEAWRRIAGANARAAIHAGRGAADRSAALIEQIMPQGGPAAP